MKYKDSAKLIRLPRELDKSLIMMLRKVIFGGQTGVDRAGLDAAMKVGIPVGGYCPKGRGADLKSAKTMAYSKVLAESIPSARL